MCSDPPPSLAPARTPHERATAFIGHSVVNGMGVLGLTSMHLYGSLSAEWATGGILALCGVWTFNTRKGPPPGAAGLVGLVTWLSTLRV